MAISARDLWWESCFSNSMFIASTLARKTQRKWSWSWRAGTSTKHAISLFFALMHPSEKNETAFRAQRRRSHAPYTKGNFDRLGVRCPRFVADLKESECCDE